MATITALAQHYGRNGLTQKEAITTANRKAARILTNKEFDGRLVLSDTWKSEKEVYPAWTGTYVGFKGEGKTLGDAIKYTDSKTGTIHVFEVPKEYQNEKNSILVVQHGFLADGKPILTLNEDGKNMLVDVADKSKIVLLPHFPSSDGWYIADKQFGIPLGNKVSQSDPEARHLWRADEYSGLLACGVALSGIRRNVNADFQPSFRFGVLISTENAAMGVPNSAPKPAIAVATTEEMKQVVAKAKEEAEKSGDALENVNKALAWAEQQLGAQ